MSISKSSRELHLDDTTDVVYDDISDDSISGDVLDDTEIGDCVIIDDSDAIAGLKRRDIPQRITSGGDATRPEQILYHDDVIEEDDDTAPMAPCVAQRRNKRTRNVRLDMHDEHTIAEPDGSGDRCVDGETDKKKRKKIQLQIKPSSQQTIVESSTLSAQVEKAADIQSCYSHKPQHERLLTVTDGSKCFSVRDIIDERMRTDAGVLSTDENKLVGDVVTRSVREGNTTTPDVAMLDKITPLAAFLRATDPSVVPDPMVDTTSENVLRLNGEPIEKPVTSTVPLPSQASQAPQADGVDTGSSLPQQLLSTIDGEPSKVVVSERLKSLMPRLKTSWYFKAGAKWFIGCLGAFGQYGHRMGPCQDTDKRATTLLIEDGAACSFLSRLWVNTTTVNPLTGQGQIDHGIDHFVPGITDAIEHRSSIADLEVISPEHAARYFFPASAVPGARECAAGPNCKAAKHLYNPMAAAAVTTDCRTETRINGRANRTANGTRDGGVILRELMGPQDEERFYRYGVLPEAHGLCIICIRCLVESGFYRVALGKATRCTPPHVNPIDAQGAYRSDAMLQPFGATDGSHSRGILSQMRDYVLSDYHPTTLEDAVRAGIVSRDLATPKLRKLQDMRFEELRNEPCGDDIIKKYRIAYSSIDLANVYGYIEDGSTYFFGDTRCLSSQADRSGCEPRRSFVPRFAQPSGYVCGISSDGDNIDSAHEDCEKLSTFLPPPSSTSITDDCNMDISPMDTYSSIDISSSSSQPVHDGDTCVAKRACEKFSDDAEKQRCCCYSDTRCDGISECCTDLMDLSDNNGIGGVTCGCSSGGTSIDGSRKISGGIMAEGFNAINGISPACSQPDVPVVQTVHSFAKEYGVSRLLQKQKQLQQEAELLSASANRDVIVVDAIAPGDGIGRGDSSKGKIPTVENIFDVIPQSKIPRYLLLNAPQIMPKLYTVVRKRIVHASLTVTASTTMSHSDKPSGGAPTKSDGSHGRGGGIYMNKRLIRFGKFGITSPIGEARLSVLRRRTQKRKRRPRDLTKNGMKKLLSQSMLRFHKTANEWKAMSKVLSERFENEKDMSIVLSAVLMWPFATVVSIVRAALLPRTSAAPDWKRRLSPTWRMLDTIRAFIETLGIWSTVQYPPRPWEYSISILCAARIEIAEDVLVSVTNRHALIRSCKDIKSCDASMAEEYAAGASDDTIYDITRDKMHAEMLKTVMSAAVAVAKIQCSISSTEITALSCGEIYNAPTIFQQQQQMTAGSSSSSQQSSKSHGPKKLDGRGSAAKAFYAAHWRLCSVVKERMLEGLCDDYSLVEWSEGTCPMRRGISRSRIGHDETTDEAALRMANSIATAIDMFDAGNATSKKRLERQHISRKIRAEGKTPLFDTIISPSAATAGTKRADIADTDSRHDIDGSRDSDSDDEMADGQESVGASASASAIAKSSSKTTKPSKLPQHSSSSHQQHRTKGAKCFVMKCKCSSVVILRKRGRPRKYEDVRLCGKCGSKIICCQIENDVHPDPSTVIITPPQPASTLPPLAVTSALPVESSIAVAATTASVRDCSQVIGSSATTTAIPTDIPRITSWNWAQLLRSLDVLPVEYTTALRSRIHYILDLEKAATLIISKYSSDPTLIGSSKSISSDMDVSARITCNVSFACIDVLEAVAEFETEHDLVLHLDPVMRERISCMKERINAQQDSESDDSEIVDSENEGTIARRARIYRGLPQGCGSSVSLVNAEKRSSAQVDDAIESAEGLLSVVVPTIGMPMMNEFDPEERHSNGAVPNYDEFDELDKMITAQRPRKMQPRTPAAIAAAATALAAITTTSTPLPQSMAPSQTPKSVQPAHVLDDGEISTPSVPVALDAQICVRSGKRPRFSIAESVVQREFKDADKGGEHGVLSSQQLQQHLDKIVSAERVSSRIRAHSVASPRQTTASSSIDAASKAANATAAAIAANADACEERDSAVPGPFSKDYDVPHVGKLAGLHSDPRAATVVYPSSEERLASAIGRTMDQSRGTRIHTRAKKLSLAQYVQEQEHQLLQPSTTTSSAKSILWYPNADLLQVLLSSPTIQLQQQTRRIDENCGISVGEFIGSGFWHSAELIRKTTFAAFKETGNLPLETCTRIVNACGGFSSVIGFPGTIDNPWSMHQQQQQDSDGSDKITTPAFATWFIATALVIRVRLAEIAREFSSSVGDVQLAHAATTFMLSHATLSEILGKKMWSSAKLLCDAVLIAPLCDITDTAHKVPDGDSIKKKKDAVRITAYTPSLLEIAYPADHFSRCDSDATNVAGALSCAGFFENIDRISDSDMLAFKNIMLRTYIPRSQAFDHNQHQQQHCHSRGGNDTTTMDGEPDKSSANQMKTISEAVVVRPEIVPQLCGAIERLVVGGYPHSRNCPGFAKALQARDFVAHAADDMTVSIAVDRMTRIALSIVGLVREAASYVELCSSDIAKRVCTASDEIYHEYMDTEMVETSEIAGHNRRSRYYTANSKTGDDAALDAAALDAFAEILTTSFVPTGESANPGRATLSFGSRNCSKDGSSDIANPCEEKSGGTADITNCISTASATIVASTPSISITGHGTSSIPQYHTDKDARSINVLRTIERLLASRGTTPKSAMTSIEDAVYGDVYCSLVNDVSSTNMEAESSINPTLLAALRACFGCDVMFKEVYDVFNLAAKSRLCDKTYKTVTQAPSKTPEHDGTALDDPMIGKDDSGEKDTVGKDDSDSESDSDSDEASKKHGSTKSSSKKGELAAEESESDDDGSVHGEAGDNYDDCLDEIGSDDAADKSKEQCAADRIKQSILEASRSVLFERKDKSVYASSALEAVKMLAHAAMVWEVARRMAREAESVAEELIDDLTRDRSDGDDISDDEHVVDKSHYCHQQHQQFAKDHKSLCDCAITENLVAQLARAPATSRAFRDCAEWFPEFVEYTITCADAVRLMYAINHGDMEREKMTGFKTDPLVNDIAVSTACHLIEKDIWQGKTYTTKQPTTLTFAGKICERAVKIASKLVDANARIGPLYGPSRLHVEQMREVVFAMCAAEESVQGRMAIIASLSRYNADDSDKSDGGSDGSECSTSTSKIANGVSLGSKTRWNEHLPMGVDGASICDIGDTLKVALLTSKTSDIVSSTVSSLNITPTVLSGSDNNSIFVHGQHHGEFYNEPMVDSVEYIRAIDKHRSSATADAVDPSVDISTATASINDILIANTCSISNLVSRVMSFVTTNANKSHQTILSSSPLISQLLADKETNGLCKIAPINASSVINGLPIRCLGGSEYELWRDLSMFKKFGLSNNGLCYVATMYAANAVNDHAVFDAIVDTCDVSEWRLICEYYNALGIYTAAKTTLTMSSATNERVITASMMNHDMRSWDDVLAQFCAFIVCPNYWQILSRMYANPRPDVQKQQLKTCYRGKDASVIGAKNVALNLADMSLLCAEKHAAKVSAAQMASLSTTSLPIDATTSFATYRSKSRCCGSKRGDDKLAPATNERRIIAEIRRSASIIESWRNALAQRSKKGRIARGGLLADDDPDVAHETLLDDRTRSRQLSLLQRFAMADAFGIIDCNTAAIPKTIIKGSVARAFAYHTFDCRESGLISIYMFGAAVEFPTRPLSARKCDVAEERKPCTACIGCSAIMRISPMDATPDGRGYECMSCQIDKGKVPASCQICGSPMVQHVEHAVVVAERQAVTSLSSRNGHVEGIDTIFDMRHCNTCAATLVVDTPSNSVKCGADDDITDDDIVDSDIIVMDDPFIPSASQVTDADSGAATITTTTHKRQHCDCGDGDSEYSLLRKRQRCACDYHSGSDSSVDIVAVATGKLHRIVDSPVGIDKDKQITTISSKTADKISPVIIRPQHRAMTSSSVVATLPRIVFPLQTTKQSIVRISALMPTSELAITVARENIASVTRKITETKTKSAERRDQRSVAASNSGQGGNNVSKDRSCISTTTTSASKSRNQQHSKCAVIVKRGRTLQKDGTSCGPLEEQHAVRVLSEIPEYAMTCAWTCDKCAVASTRSMQRGVVPLISTLRTKCGSTFANAEGTSVDTSAIDIVQVARTVQAMHHATYIATLRDMDK